MVRIFCLLCLCLFLSGCVLESAKPAFDDSQAALVFGDKVRSITPWSITDGVWAIAENEGETVAMQAEGNHYRLTIGERDKEKVAVISFVPLGKDRFVLQFEDKADSSEDIVYALGKRDGDAVMFQPLMCSKLKERAAGGEAVDFVERDCRLKEGADALSYFRALSETWTDFEQKMVPVY